MSSWIHYNGGIFQFLFNTVKIRRAWVQTLHLKEIAEKRAPVLLTSFLHHQHTPEDPHTLVITSYTLVIVSPLQYKHKHKALRPDISDPSWPEWSGNLDSLSCEPRPQSQQTSLCCEEGRGNKNPLLQQKLIHQDFSKITSWFNMHTHRKCIIYDIWCFCVLRMFLLTY